LVWDASTLTASLTLKKTQMKKVLLFFVLAVAATTVQAQPLADANDRLTKQLSWETQSYDFGIMEQAKAQTATFKFQNNTDEVVFIKTVKPTCGCTVADYTRSAIQPSEWAEVKANYNAAAAGMFRKTIQVTTSASTEAVVLTISGEVK
jgi:carbonic anhydrase